MGKNKKMGKKMGEKRVHCRSDLIPEVSGQVPCIKPNMFPQALLTAAILARTGKLWMTKDTSVRCCRARFWAWPRIPNPVMSVAACALKVCISPAAGRKERQINVKCLLEIYLWAALMCHVLTCSVESSHVQHGLLISQFNILLSDNQLYLIPFLWLRQKER